MKEIVVITTGWFPEGDAGAVRLFTMSKSMLLAGYSVTVLCRGKANDSETYEGVKCVSLRNRTGKVSKIFDYYAFPKKVKQYLKSKKSDIFGVYIYHGIHLSLLNFCKSFCKKNDIGLYFDCVEWFSPEEYRFGKMNLSYRTNNKINTKILDPSFSVIAISRYLQEYFEQKNIKTVRIPVLCDSSKRTAHKSQNGEKLTLFYAGSPVKKDLVGNVLAAVPMLDAEERSKLRIVFVGTTREYLVNLSEIAPEVIDACSDVLELCGRVPRAEVLRLMEEADFVLLPRDASLRYAKAGFPSKVVEALANATPIFCNISSDLGEFLTDGENSVISESHRPEDIAKAIKRAVRLTPEQKNNMSKNALETAKNHFDYRLYAEVLDKLFSVDR